MTTTTINRELEIRNLERLPMQRHTAVAVFNAASRYVTYCALGDDQAAIAVDQSFLRTIGRPMEVDMAYQELIERMLA